MITIIRIKGEIYFQKHMRLVWQDVLMNLIRNMFVSTPFKFPSASRSIVVDESSSKPTVDTGSRFYLMTRVYTQVQIVYVAHLGMANVTGWFQFTQHAIYKLPRLFYLTWNLWFNEFIFKLNLCTATPWLLTNII